ncbi:hypothetical protein BsWGS_28877 [Bradybaena similaris]
MIALVTLVPDNHFKAAVIAAISILILDVVDLYATLCSATLHLILVEKFQPELSPRCTEPSVCTTASSSLALQTIRCRAANPAVPVHHISCRTANPVVPVHHSCRTANSAVPVHHISCTSAPYQLPTPLYQCTISAVGPPTLLYQCTISAVGLPTLLYQCTISAVGQPTPLYQCTILALSVSTVPTSLAQCYLLFVPSMIFFSHLPFVSSKLRKAVGQNW